MHNQSKYHAKSVLMLGHTHSGMGERVLCLKWKEWLQEAGLEVGPILDIMDVMQENYEPFARINYDLAENGHSLMEDLKEIILPQADVLVVLSWCLSLAAVFATGVQKKYLTLARLFVHHPEEKIPLSLYTPADLLVTEALLANERALFYGIPSEHILYVPHTYPIIYEKLRSKTGRIQELAARLGKFIARDTLIIGCVGRIEYGKNCECAIEAVRRLVEKGYKVTLVLKGDFPQETPYPDYKKTFLNWIAPLEHLEWFLWDRTYTPFAEIGSYYADFDVLLHPSGAEGGSHVVVEVLALNKPVVLLDCSTQPYLFRGLATFVKPDRFVSDAPLPFYFPDMDDLVDKLISVLRHMPHPDQTRVQERFHPDQAKRRIPLFFERDPEKMDALYQEDRKVYGI